MSEPTHCPTCHQDWAHCLCYPRHAGQGMPAETCLGCRLPEADCICGTL